MPVVYLLLTRHSHLHVAQPLSGGIEPELFLDGIISNELLVFTTIGNIQLTPRLLFSLDLSFALLS